MIFSFKIMGDQLRCSGRNSGYTGNVNTYFCEFDIQTDIDGLLWFCVFHQKGEPQIRPIEDGRCVIPEEILIDPIPFSVGCFGTDVDFDIDSDIDPVKRVSTNFVRIDLGQGAYSKGNTPKVPTPDVWEILLKKHLPIIGENGNWYLYDITTGEYKDSGVCAKGEKGDSIAIDDEMSDESTNSVQNKVVKKYIDEENTALDNRISNIDKTANEAIQLAKGNSVGYVFDTEDDMRAWLQISDNVNRLVPGKSHFYIRDINVPDYWWDGNGYLPLESNTDLSEYPQKSDFKTVNGESVLGEGDIKIQSGIKGIARQTTTTSGWVEFEPDENGIIRIPCAGKGKPGLIAVGSGFNVTSPHGYCAVVVASENSIKNRWGNNMIDSSIIDLAVKYAMTDGVGKAWSDAQKLAALLRMGCTVDGNNFIRWGDKTTATSFADGSTLSLRDNTSYTACESITTLIIEYPDTDFISSIVFTTAETGDITISLPSSRYIGVVPVFSNNETWELNIKNGVVVGGKVE